MLQRRPLKLIVVQPLQSIQRSNSTWEVIIESIFVLFSEICAYQVIAKRKALVGSRTMVIAPESTEFNEMLGNRMQYELQKVGVQAALFRSREYVPTVEGIAEATRFARRTGVSSIIAIGPVCAIDTAKSVKFFLEQDSATQLSHTRAPAIDSAPSSFAVPLLAFPTSYAYTSCQPTVGACIPDKHADLLRFVSPSPDVSLLMRAYHLHLALI